MHSIIEQRLTQIRKWLVENNLNAFIIPHEDSILVNMFLNIMTVYIGLQDLLVLLESRL